MNSTTTALTTINAIAEAQNTEIIEKVNQICQVDDPETWSAKLLGQNNTRHIVPENCERIVRIGDDVFYLNESGKFICGSIPAAMHFGSFISMTNVMGTIATYYGTVIYDFNTMQSTMPSPEIANGIFAMGRAYDPNFGWSSEFTGKTKIMYSANAISSAEENRMIGGYTITVDIHTLEVVKAETTVAAMNYVTCMKSLSGTAQKPVLNPTAPTTRGYMRVPDFEILRHAVSDELTQYSDYKAVAEQAWIGEYNKLIQIEMNDATAETPSTDSNESDNEVE